MSGKTTLGRRIRELRLQAKLSQRELAERLAKRLKNFDFTYLSKIENDRLVPSATALVGMAAELNGDSDELLALAGKAPADVGDMLQKSEGARMFFRSAFSARLSEDDWKALEKIIKKSKKQ